MVARSPWDYFKQMPDPRRGQGTRYPLPSMLGVVVAASLSGRSSLRAIARWAKRLAPEQLVELELHRGRAPGQTAMHDLFDRNVAGVFAKAEGISSSR